MGQGQCKSFYVWGPHKRVPHACFPVHSCPHPVAAAPSGCLGPQRPSSGLCTPSKTPPKDKDKEKTKSR